MAVTYWRSQPDSAQGRRLLHAAKVCVLAYLRLEKSAAPDKLRRLLGPHQQALLAAALEELLDEGAVVRRPGPGGVRILRADTVEARA